MPFQLGSITARRYRVVGEVSIELSRTATIALRGRAWRPIDPSRGEKESIGWVNPRNVLAETFSYEEVMISHNLMLLGFRRDRKAFNKTLFRARRQALIRRVMAEKKLEKISKQQRIALEEQLAIEMLTETSPVSAFYELIWDLNSGIVLMGAASNALCEKIGEHFEATFDLKLHPIFPAIVGGQFIANNSLDEEYGLATAAAESIA